MTVTEYETAPKNKKINSTPVLETGHVRKELAAVWPGGKPPETMVKAVAESGNLREVLSALKNIKKIAQKGDEMYLNSPVGPVESHNVEDTFNELGDLSRGRLTRMFVQNPGVFERIAKSIDERDVSIIFEKLGSMLDQLGFDDSIFEMFARNPALFERMAKTLGRDKWGPIYAAGYERHIVKMFSENPEAVVGYFERISKVSREYDSFGIFRSGAGEFTSVFSELFAKYPDAFVRVAEAAGGNARDVFSGLTWALDNEKVMKAFGNDSSAFFRYFERLARLSGSEAGKVFSALRDALGHDSLMKLFAKNPEVLIKLVTATGKDAGSAFRALEDDMVADFLAMDTEFFIILAKAAGKDIGFVSKEVVEAAFFEVHGKGIRDYDKYLAEINKTAKFVESLGANHRSPEVVANFNWAISVIGEEKTKELYKEFGIEFFGRYKIETLEELYNKMGDSNDTRPVLLIAYNKNDYNGAFYQEGDKIDGLMKSQYYNTIIVEVDSEYDFYNRVSEISDKYFGIETMIIGGHGEPERITLGSGGDETALDLTDIGKMKQLSNCFVNKPTIILNSCSTGKNEAAIGAVISRIWDAKLFAPKVPTGISSLETNELGQIVGVTYRRESTEFDAGTEKPKKKGKK